jgi:hypothetical protein
MLDDHRRMLGKMRAIDDDGLLTTAQGLLQ